ncbi:IS3 family transposase [Dolosigranulum savutiense]
MANYEWSFLELLKQGMCYSQNKMSYDTIRHRIKDYIDYYNNYYIKQN